MWLHDCAEVVAQFLLALVDFDLDQSRHIDERSSTNAAK